MIEKLNARMTISTLVVVAKLIAIVALVLLLTQCSPKSSADNGPFSEFDYSLGKTATQSQSASPTAPQSYNYGHTKK